MNLGQKLRHLKQAAKPRGRDEALESTLEYLRRLDQPTRKLPSHRVPKAVEEYVEGRTERNSHGEFFLAKQSLPFGRPYGKLRVGDVSTADLSPLVLFLGNRSLPEPSQLAYLDTETTGLVGGTGTYAFLVGIGAVEGSQFVVRQFFLRDYTEEKAMLAGLAELLEPYQGLVTFNGKTFDVPLLETRYALARMKSPFARLLHFDALHPARCLWKLRLETCELTRLEREVLGISREGDVEGSEIPGIYFEYLRTGDARGLQPVFYHNALDIVTLAALMVELAKAVGEGGADQEMPSLDLFSLSRIFDRAGVRDQSVATCQRALSAGLPEAVRTRALWHLASHLKRHRQYQEAAEIWIELARREESFAIDALEELAIYHEHRRGDFANALRFVETAIERLQSDRGAGLNPAPTQKSNSVDRFAHRLERLRRKSARTSASSLPPSHI